jgi:large subunit ribosomal protein L13
MKTYSAKPGEITREWYLVDATGLTLGRLATVIADTLRGKRKPVFTPHVDTGDFVVVVNAEKIAVTGAKLDQKMYYRHSGYPGGIKSRSLRDQLERRPTEVLRTAVKGMLPKNRLARQQLTKLKIYAGPEHPHESQNPSPSIWSSELSQIAQYRGTGKRKTSVARVILRPGDGATWINGRTIDEYFPRNIWRTIATSPLKIAGVEGQYDLRVRVHGGGLTGQAGAVRHGIARALVEANPELRVPLKREGFLTRDARQVERKKAGLHKARKAPQFSKR